MRLQGVLEIGVGPSQVRDSLNDAEVLRALLPGDCKVTPKGDGAFDFTLKKTFGFLELSQSGQILVSDPAPGQLRLTIQASHIIGGSVNLDMMMALAPQGPRTSIGYDGTLEAGGLAGRVLRDREAQVSPYVQRVFERLKARIESGPPAQV